METPVLDGYTTLLVDGQKFLVPDFAVDEVKMRLAGDIKRKVMGAENMTEKPRSRSEYGPCYRMAQGSVRCVQDPGLSKRELLALHAEVKALQEQLGLSYKDSAHRLYLAEVARLKTLHEAHCALADIRQRIDKILDHELVAPVAQLKTEYQRRAHK